MFKRAQSTTPSSTNGGEPDGNARVSFSEVARAHYRWDVKGGRDESGREAARQAFDAALARFQADAKGRVVEDYWCQKQASGVALVEIREARLTRFRRMLRRLQLWYPVPEYRIFRETNWVTVELPLRNLANLLHECDVLAIKARWGLEGIHQAVVIPWLMAVEAHILGFIESDWRQREEWKKEKAPPGEREAARRKREAERKRAADVEAERFYTDTVHELNRIEDYYQSAGRKRARMHFMMAMLLFGVPLVGLAAVASAVPLALFGLDLDGTTVQRFYACMAAGALGATVSVLMRMSREGSFTIDHELGAAGVRRLGIVRPIIGAVLGVVVSLLVQTALVPVEEQSLTTEFLIVIAFLAGFSERWTKAMFEGAMRTVTTDDEAASRTARDAAS